MTGILQELSQDLAAGKTSARELTEQSLSRITETDKTLNAFITVDADGARCAAAESDARRAAGNPLSPYDGIPYAAKDNFETVGLRTTCASELRKNHLPTYDAAAIERLRRAGFVLVGKTNMDEFAMGSVTAASAFGASHNPRDPARTCGGSSGGSAAAVAAKDVTVALGSDTGGSVRQPAAFCGTVGVKPTYGRISRWGLAPFAPSLDTAGVVTETVADAAVLVDVLSGYDRRDPTSLSAVAEPCTGRLGAGVRGLRVGIIRDGGNTEAVDMMLETAARVLSDGGASVAHVAFPFRKEAAITYRILAYVEGASTLAGYDGTESEIRDCGKLSFEVVRGMGFGYEVKRRVLFGTLMASEKGASALEAARAIREAVRNCYAELFGRYDVVLRATAPFGAFRLNRKLTSDEGCDMDYSTVCESLAGIPAMSVPFGCDADGMPLGIQVVAPWMGESVLFGIGAYLEEQVKK